LNFNEYQEWTSTTSILNDMQIDYFTIALAGEVGEIAEKVKKVFRDKNGVFDPKDKKALAKELGDVMWYIAQFSRNLGYPLQEIIEMNIEKLESRKKRNVLGGSGDSR